MKPALCLVLFCLMASPAWSFDHQHQAWSTLLGAHVRWTAQGHASRVDYAGLVPHHADLSAYLATLSAVTAEEYAGWSDAQRRAFLLNAYNAYTLELILGTYPELESIRDLGSLYRSPWKREFFSLLGRSQSLDGIEHGLLRGASDYDDPRIHFAVNCASVGCPALRPEAYRAEDLERQLQDQTVRFLSDRSRNRYDAGAATLYLSPIFDWYAEDFAKAFRGSQSLAGFLALYREALAMGDEDMTALADDAIDIAFLDYDWSLNDARTAPSD